MRILICSNVYPPNFIGGAELVAHSQARALRAAGHQVRVFAGMTEARARHYEVRRDLHDDLMVERVQLASTDFQIDRVNFLHPQVERHFTRLLNDYRPEVVHVHNPVGLSAALTTLSREFGAATVMTLHDHWGFCFKNTLMKTGTTVCTDFSRCYECRSFIDSADGPLPIEMRRDYLELAMGSVDAFVSPSRYLAQAYISTGLPARKFHVISYGVDTDRFARITRRTADGKIRLTFIGHFGIHKGVTTLLAALAQTSGAGDCIVNLVGEGDEAPVYREQLSAAGLESRVKFWGKLSNEKIEEVYAQTDVLVLPSIWPENQPVTVTEAMASGIPVIASRVGGNPELVEDGSTGFLFEPGNAVDLAEKINRFVSDPALLETLGRNGQRRMSGNTFAHTATELIALYERIDSTAAPTGPVDRPLIVCVGESFSRPCFEGVRYLPYYCSGVVPRVVMAAWLTSRQLAEAALVWMTDGSATRASLAPVANCGAALLVPESSRTLVDLCRSESCGLYYRNGHEAAAMIAHLLEHPGDYRRLADNAARLWKSA